MYIIIILKALTAVILLRKTRFGKKPGGKRLLRIRESTNYRNGTFQNQSITPSLTDGDTYFSIIRKFVFGKSKRAKPTGKIPSIQTNLLTLEKNKDVLVWFGHSSYFMQMDGKRILVDPVFSGHASPFFFSVKAFKGSDIYTPEDMPEIDYLFISHDHWDHLDHKTLLKLKPKIKKIICGLGTGEHLECWGFDKNILIEKDWNETIVLENGFTVHTVPGRHFSGRGLTRNKTLWLSFVLKTPTMQLFIGGDSGYDKHFEEIGKTFGVFDLVILENGQYNKSWKHIHMMPAEVLKAAKELNAKRLLPVHSSKFSLALHAWDEPLSEITKLNNQLDIPVPVITPMIGEMVNLKDETQEFAQWWEGV